MVNTTKKQIAKDIADVLKEMFLLECEKDIYAYNLAVNYIQAQLEKYIMIDGNVSVVNGNLYIARGGTFILHSDIIFLDGFVIADESYAID